jgi:ketosteroid isomerase-like protein
VSQENLDLVRKMCQEVETDTAVIYTVKDGSVVRVDPYMDRDQALEAAGLTA